MKNRYQARMALHSELSPDLCLWSAFLRSGRADVFRLAEALTRRTFRQVEGPAAMKPLDEPPWMSTNVCSQFEAGGDRAPEEDVS